MKTRPTSTPRARRHSGPVQCAVLCLVGGLFLGGCASSTEVKIDSLAKPRAEDAISYRIHNAHAADVADLFQYKVGVGSASTALSGKAAYYAPPATPADLVVGLDDKEAVGIVSTALSAKGMVEAPPGTPADLVVDLDYGISPPQRRYQTEMKQIVGNVPGESTPVSRTVGMDSAGVPINQTTYVQGPSTMGLIGSRDALVALDIYEKHLRLSARENKVAEEGKPAPEVWTVDVISEGETRDLRKALPILAAVASDYVGKDAHGEKIVRRQDTDHHVVYVK